MDALAKPERTGANWLLKIPNATKIAACGDIKQKLCESHGAVFVFAHHRRKFNAAPDELCNAHLDGRAAKAEKLAKVPKTPFNDHIFVTAMDWPSRRFLPRELFPQWRRVISLLASAEPTERNTKIMLMAPRLLLSHLRRGDYARHLGSLQTMDDVIDYLADLTPVERQHDTLSIGDSVLRYFSDGMVSKALDAIVDPTSMADPTKELADKFWPGAVDTTPLMLPDKNIVFDPALVEVIARRRLRSKKAGDIGGWTKELFNAAGSALLLPTLQRCIGDYANQPNNVRAFLATDRGLMIQQATKIRPASVGSLWAKIAWHHQFAKCQTPHLPYQLPSSEAAVILAEVVKTSPTVIKTDCTNAFHSIERVHIQRALVALNLEHLFPLWNIFYARRTAIRFRTQAGGHFLVTINRGVRAGCVSASELFQLGLRGPLQNIAKSLATPIAVIDDIYVPAPIEAIPLAAELAVVGLTLNLSKTSAVTDSEVAKTKLGTWMTPKSTIEPHVVTYPAKTKADAVIAADVPAHLKFHMLQLLFRRSLYGLRHLTTDNSPSILHAFSEVWRESISRLIGAEIPRLLFHSPLEAGGLNAGVECHIDYWHRRNANIRARYASTYKYPMSHPPQEPTESETQQRKCWHERNASDPILTGNLPNGLLAIQESHKREPMEDWLAFTPTYAWHLNDQDFKCAMMLRCGLTPPGYQPCEHAFEGTLWDHAVKCKVCAKPTLRHNLVVGAIASVLRSKGIVVATNTNSLPLPKTIREKTSQYVSDNDIDKGPDAEVYIAGKQCIDVTISAPWQGKQRDVLHNVYMRKVHNYEEWSTFYAMKCHPIVFSIFGNVHRGTRAIFDEWEKTLHSSGLALALITAINKALLHAITSAVTAAVLQRKIKDYARESRQASSAAASAPLYVHTATSPAPVPPYPAPGPRDASSAFSPAPASLFPAPAIPSSASAPASAPASSAPAP